jgi:hypothetical protein
MSSTPSTGNVSHDMEEPSTIGPVVSGDNAESHAVVFRGAEVAVITVDDGDQDSKQSSPCGPGKKRTWLFATTMILTVLGVVLAAVLSGKSSGDGNGNPGKTTSPAYDYEERFTVFRNALITESDPTAFFDPDSPQSLALQWMVYQDQTVSLDNLDRLTQRYVIMVLYYACGGENWRGYITPLIEEVKTNECDLKDFGCDEFGYVTAVKLDERGMVGRLPFEIGLLSALTELNLFNNDLEGAIPESTYGLKNLSKSFFNTLYAFRECCTTEAHTIIDRVSPKSHTHLSAETLILDLNRFSSTISPNIGKLTNLEVLLLYRNSMTGSLPSSVAQLSNLRTISLGYNDLEGPFTSYLSHWPELQIIEIKQTLLTGILPTTIGLLTKLTVLAAAQCQLDGTIPSELALLSNTLAFLSLGGPNLEGTLPESIGDLTLLSKCSFRDQFHDTNCQFHSNRRFSPLLCLFSEP